MMDESYFIDLCFLIIMVIQIYPPTEKLHQIIARTALFVSKHGGQSEIVLRVKQGDNPTFGFLMPDHHLHPYFRFLVDHQELLMSDVNGKDQGKKADTDENQAGGVGGSGALSLLGSVYGSGEDEDEDGATEDTTKLRENDSVEIQDSPHTLRQSEDIVNVIGKDGLPPKHPVPSSKGKLPASKLVRSIGSIKAGTTNSLKKVSYFSATAEKSQTSAPLSTPKTETSILEPSSDLKRLIDKIVEFILRNGKDFEAVLAEQDSNHMRFPFLLPSNQYHPYYLKVLQKAQESKNNGKSKDDSIGHGSNKKPDLAREIDDIPDDSDKKEKFKMVISKPKKDGSDPPKPTQPQIGVSVDAASAAAILQAATRGFKNPDLEILSKTSSFGNLSSSQPQKPDQIGESERETDSSETREQKLKAERLKRAKMFAAMIKSGKTEPLLGVSSVERPESRVSPLEVQASEKGEKLNDDKEEDNEWRSKRKYRSRSKRHDDDEDEDREDELSKRKHCRSRSRSKRHDDDEDEDREAELSKRKHQRSCSRSKRHDDDEDEDRDDVRSKRKHHRSRSISKRHDEDDDDVDDEDRGRDHKHSKKQHRSHRSSSRHSSDQDKHRRRHGETEYSSEEEEHRHHHKRTRKRQRDGSSESEEHRHLHHKRRSKRERDSSSEEDHRDKHHKSRSKREVDIEEGEISRETTPLEVVSSNQNGRGSSWPSETTTTTTTTTVVSDDLRAKIRAMLMATL